MINIHTLSLFLAGIILASAGQAAEPPRGDAAAGKEKSTVCAGCHGPTGMADNPRYPHLAGQHYQYLLDAITAYREGGRRAPVMAPMAQLSDQDIRDLAAFYAAQPRCRE